jgi:hypothetical protein
MAETIGGTRGSQQIVVKGYNPNFIVEKKVNGSDFYPGLICTGYGETDPDVDLCSTGEPPLGVVIEHFRNDGLAGTVRDTPDIDAVYTDNALVRVAVCGSGMACLCFAKQTTTAVIYPGSKLFVGATAAGYLDVAATTDTFTSFISYVGNSLDYDAGGVLAKVITVII